MLKVNFDKYTKEFKEYYYKYFMGNLSKREVKSIFGENVSNVSEDYGINKQLKDLIREYIKKCINRRDISHISNLRRIAFLIRLLQNLKNILIGDMDFLRLFIKKITIEPFLCEALNDKSLLDNLNKIFFEYGYKQKIMGEKIAYKLIEQLNVKTCPYCNINYAYVLKKGNIRPQLDHFFPRDKYPFFAISLANLIPSCPVCNHKKRDKFDDNLKLKSPFEIDSFEDFKFTFIPDKDLTSLIAISLDVIEKNLRIDFIKGNLQNINTFALKERYNQHKDIVAEIILKEKLINEAKEEMDLNVIFSSLSGDERNIYRLIYCNYLPISEEDFLRRPFSKLTCDIYSELKQK